ncbi:hypothetical protein [Bradyrhizobium sp. Leo170]|uniref:hypothetical protein n=1 Tax=Bradyrhizobium sp. Leo170 TaxID=1571199 RepID=UPI00102E3C16|nr:hypothetical protein [Bradyrhizobium sp. Leo170]
MARSKAISFVAISMGCQDIPKHKVRFKPISIFEKGRPKSGFAAAFSRESPVGGVIGIAADLALEIV